MSYGKVDEAYWDDDSQIAGVSDRAALLGLFLVTGPHRNAIGCFRLGIGAITDIPRFGRWGFEGASKALQELIDIGFIVRDADTGWTFVTKVFKHDPIRSPNAARHALTLVERVPKNSHVYQSLRSSLAPQLEGYSKDLKNKDGYPLPTPSEGASKALGKPIATPLPSPLPSPSPLPKENTRQHVATPAAREPDADDSAVLPDPQESIEAIPFEGSSDPPAADPILTGAKAIMAAHAQATIEIFAQPGWQPHHDDLAIAKSLARAGITAGQAGPVLRRLLERERDQNRRPPRALAYFEDEIRNSMTGQNGANGKARDPIEEMHKPRHGGFLPPEVWAERIAAKPPEERAASLASIPDEAKRAEVERLLPKYLEPNEIIGDVPAGLRR